MWWKRIGIALGVLLVAAGIAFYVLLLSPMTVETCEVTLDLARTRELASSIPGDKPSEIRVERVSGSEMPLAIASAGMPWEAAPFEMYAYQLVFADKTLIVDTTMSLAQAADMGPTDTYDAAAFARVQKAMQSASAIFVTHEHTDHLGGAVAGEPLPTLRLTRAQLESDAGFTPEIPETFRSVLQILPDEPYQAVAPGVVLIKAPGHTPGSQMVFVSRADGTEVILTGDTAWLALNIEREQGPARLVALMTSGDRVHTACELRALHHLPSEVAVMPGHDPERMRALLDKGVFRREFK